MKRPIFTLFLASAAAALGQTDTDQKLPRLDVFGSKGATRPKLGYEGTPLDPKKAPKPEPKAKGQTEITSLEATFDQRLHQAVFIGNVVVNDPEFVVNCDRMTAFLKNTKEEAEKAKVGPDGQTVIVAATPIPAASPKPKKKDANATPGADPDSKGGGLDHAIAEADPGKEVVITQDKIEADGSITKNIGRGKKATYDSKTGNIVLYGSPSVQQGINLCVAQTEETVMTLNRNGYNRVDGLSKTVIKDSATISDSK